MASNFADQVLAHPANGALIAYLSRHMEHSRWSSLRSCSPSAVEKPYFNLGTHPDCVEQLWNKLGGALSEDSSWVLWGKPVLAHPESAIVFAFATGTIYALRLDLADVKIATAAKYRSQHIFGNKSMLDVSEFGATWIVGKWKDEEQGWIVRASRFAAS